MNTLWLGLAGGALAFAHCLGMCGGFALHLAQGQSHLGVLGRQLLWHSGRAFTYVFLGSLAGFGGGLVGSIQRLPWIQDALAYTTGGFMILMGLSLLGVVPIRFHSEPDSEGLLSSLLRRFFFRPGYTAAIVLGVATGFLPCPIVLGFLALSAQSGSVLTGMLTMAAVGLGTVWSLLLVGLTGHLVSRTLRRQTAVIGGAVLILLGASTALRGTEMYHHVFGCPAVKQAELAGPPCCRKGPAQ